MLQPRELLARRSVEMGYFRDSLLSPEALNDSADPGHFRAMVALATSDYQVSTTELADSLQVSEQQVICWGDNDRDDLKVPSQDVRERVITFIAADIGKKLEELN